MVEVGNFKFIETKIPDLYIVEPKKWFQYMISQ